MPTPHETGRVLAIDIGATAIKVAEVSLDGDGDLRVQRHDTPYPCPPERLVEDVAREVESRECRHVGVGFPGDMRDGIVVEPGNLSRRGGIATPVDPALHAAWVGFDLQGALRRETGHDVRVVNDATMAALGCTEGLGRELVFTLGTGLGIALVVDGEPERIRDIGAEEFRAGRTYDEVFGEPARALDEAQWLRLLRLAVGDFVSEYNADAVHFGGGNARRVDVTLFSDLDAPVSTHDNLASLRGAARLFALGASEEA